MNVLNVNFSDVWGGASIAGYRTHLELLKHNINSKLLVGHKKTADSNVETIIPNKKVLYVLNKCIHKFFYHISFPNTYYLSSYYLKKNYLINKWADIILMRNIHGDYLSENLLPYISSKVPIVWRLPDMWALTGHCAYSYDCNKWKTGCNECPYLKEYYPLKVDTSNYLWRRKKSLIQKSNITVVTPSLWLKNLVEESPIFEGKNVVHIPTAVDESVFKPVDKVSIRSLFKISDDDFVIMFGAQNINDKRKGGHLIVKILNRIYKEINKNIVILTVGEGSIEFRDIPIKGIKIINFGEIKNDYLLSIIYNLADVYALPTLADNLPNTLIEAMSCGVPSVTFDAGGCGEAVIDSINGYVIKHGDIENFSNKCIYLACNNKLIRQLGLNARRTVLEKFAMEKQITSYINLFQSIINLTLSD